MAKIYKYYAGKSVELDWQFVENYFAKEIVHDTKNSRKVFDIIRTYVVLRANHTHTAKLANLSAVSDCFDTVTRIVYMDLLKNFDISKRHLILGRIRITIDHSIWRFSNTLSDIDGTVYESRKMSYDDVLNDDTSYVDYFTTADTFYTKKQHIDYEELLNEIEYSKKQFLQNLRYTKANYDKLFDDALNKLKIALLTQGVDKTEPNLTNIFGRKGTKQGTAQYVIRLHFGKIIKKYLKN